MGRDIFFSDEFMDELAERVAKKLATKFYRNKLFTNDTSHYKRHNYGYESDGGCGCGNQRYEPNGGC